VQELTFPGNYFTQSFTNFIVAGLDHPKTVAQHLYRTLQSGGQEIVCTFAFHPHDEAIKAAHLATRGSNAKLGLAYDPG
jgi:ubiquinone/menaquinone biosynthesis C-methylase UbiE